MNKKTLALVLAMVLVFTAAIGGTIAYLTSTSEVKNTFTVGGIDMDLWETEVDPETWEEDPNEATTDANTYEDIYPGAELPKDPTVTIEANSEACYLFVSVENNLPGVALFTVDSADWTAVATNGNKTLYKYNAIVAESDADQSFIVFDGVTIDPDTSKEALAAVNGQTIVIKAFAHQSTGVDADIALDAAKTTLGF